MRMIRLIRARHVQTEAERQKTLAVLRSTYQNEKAWVADVETVFPNSDLGREDILWFLATIHDEPVGVLRVVCDPPVEQYFRYGLKLIDETLKVEHFLNTSRIAEIGRFAVVPERRNSIGIVLSLMRAATREIVARGYTWLITDVFENDPHSPFGFHTRILGFKPVATHETGELRFKGRRITLLLDIKVAYRRLKARGNWFFKALTRGWNEAMHKSLAT